MSELLKSVERLEPNPNIPPLAPGDTVRVHSRIVEGDRERIQLVQGVVIRVKKGGPAASFTVRRIGAHGVGVERTFPFHSPRVEKVEVLRHGKVRRAKLYFLRERGGKSARLRERRVETPTAEQAGD
jgi:large subunit ribosomal protein L19